VATHTTSEVLIICANPPRSRGMSSAPTKSCKTAWSKNCPCRAYQTRTVPMPSCQSSVKTSTVVLQFSRAVRTMLSALCSLPKSWTSSLPIPMTQTKVDWPVSLSLFCQKTGQNSKGQCFWQLPSLWHSCRRSGRSPALPYPPHEYHKCIILFYPPLQKGTSLLCIDK